jgi:hypothetical protein
MAIFGGTTGNDDFDGTAGRDLFKLFQGGDDTASGDAGDDVFRMRFAFTAADSLTGGEGFDKLVLDGDYSAGVTLGATTLAGIEKIDILGSASCGLTMDDANVAAGERMVIKATKLFGIFREPVFSPFDPRLDFDGSAETDGHYKIRASIGDDILVGGDLRDKFFLHKQGQDTADGGGGNDTFFLRTALDPDDAIDGGAGDDTIVMTGLALSDTITLTSTTLLGVETMVLLPTFGGIINTDDATVASGSNLTVDGSALTSSLLWNGSAETNGKFDLTGGSAGDTFRGGQDGDRFTLGGGGDIVVGGAVGESSTTEYDTITDLNLDEDVFDLNVSVTGILAGGSGSISTGSFASDMGTAINDGFVQGSVKVITATGGDLIGKVFLVVEAGTGGYQDGADYVFDITGYTGTLDVGDFI